MVMVNPVPKENTNFQLLALLVPNIEERIEAFPKDLREYTDLQLLGALVPDIKERLEALKKEMPDFFEEISHRVLSKGGWTPLRWLQGAF